RYGGIKIADLESPRPANRIYTSYNYYYNVDKSGRSDGSPRLDVHREMFGFELAPALLGSNASFGMRLPFNQFVGGSFSEANIIGDLTMNMKYTLVNNAQTGTVLSGGLVMTLPTGERESAGGTPATVNVNPITGALIVTPGVAGPNISTRSVLFQPWTGGIYNFGALQVIGFSSVIVPTESRDVVIWTSSLAFGYNL